MTALVSLPPSAAHPADAVPAVAGVPVLLEAESPALAERLAAWTRRGLALTDGQATEAPLHIEVRSRAGRPAPPPEAIEIVAIGDWRMLCSRDRVFACFTHAQGVLSPAAGRALLWLAEDWWREPLKLQQVPWLCTLAWLLRERDRFALHASAVARNGTGLLFAGESGSGKSSSALSLIHAGWDWLADDVALFQPGDTPHLHGIARGFGFHPALAERLPALPKEPTANKHFAALDGLYPGRRVAACRPAAVLLPRVTGQATSRLSRASPAAALLALLPASGILLASGTPDRAQAHLRALGGLVSAVPAYRLHAGQDIFGNGAALEALLAVHGVGRPG